MSVEKTFHCYNGHAFALIAGGSDRLRGWAVGHYGINVYLVVAGITRSGGFQTAELPQWRFTETPCNFRRSDRNHLLRGAQAACLRCLAACQTQYRRQAAADCRLVACAPQSQKERCSLSFSNRVT